MIQVQPQQAQQKQVQGFSSKIIRIYLLGASVLLAFFTFAFHAGILLTENAILERRINIVAPFHFKQLESGQQQIVKADPLLTLFQKHSYLPPYIKSKVQPDWTGTQHLMLADEREFQLVAQQIMVAGEPQIVYAIEDSNPLEWDDTGFVLIEIFLVLFGIALFLITTAYMIKAARRIALPFHEVAAQLETDDVSNFDRLNPPGERTRELNQILSALNAYRLRLAKHIEREQSFTRYVSHELRTPIMVLKGTISNLKRHLSQSEDDSHQRYLEKMDKATQQMQDLTQTFLQLAREDNLNADPIWIEEGLLQQLCSELEDTIDANEIDFTLQFKDPFQLEAHPQLFKAVTHNLLKNAFGCSVNGIVRLLVDEKGIEVIDNGLGLDTKPRGYEGFGIGLVLVRDVCSKYGWQFSLENNKAGTGCTASISFNPANPSA